MKVDVRPLNKGETFCCSVKRAKEMFKDTEVHLNFAFFGRIYGTFAETPDAYFMKKNIRGQVVSAMYIYSGVAASMLSFYVVKQNEFPHILKVRYETAFLPEIFRIYQEQMKKNALINQVKLVLVEVYQNQLIMHEFDF